MSHRMFSSIFSLHQQLFEKSPERFAQVERMSLPLRWSEKTSRLDFVHPWRLTGLSVIWWSRLNITAIQYRQRDHWSQ